MSKARSASGGMSAARRRSSSYSMRYRATTSLTLMAIRHVGVTRIICHVTDIPLLPEFAKPLTHLAFARDGVKHALAKEGQH